MQIIITKIIISNEVDEKVRSSGHPPTTPSWKYKEKSKTLVKFDSKQRWAFWVMKPYYSVRALQFRGFIIMKRRENP